MIINGEFTTYSLPEEGKEAQNCFLSILHNEHETYMEMYGDTLKELYDELKVAYNKGVKLHIMLDHTQSCGPTEHLMVIDLITTCPNLDLTITTAGVDAEKSSQIAHRKRIMDVSGNVVFGSVNASRDGYFSQTNDMVNFNSVDYTTVAIVKFIERKTWAHLHHPEYQVLPLPIAVSALK